MKMIEREKMMIERMMDMLEKETDVDKIHNIVVVYEKMLNCFNMRYQVVEDLEEV